MKKLLLLTLFVLSATGLFAQDILVTHRAGNIEVKVVEITDTHVKYRKAAEPTGTVYAISRHEVQEIRFENGYVEVFSTTRTPEATTTATTPAPQAGRIAGISYENGAMSSKAGVLYMGGQTIKLKEAKDYARQYPEAMRHLRAGQAGFVGGMILAVVGGGAMGFGLGSLLSGEGLSGLSVGLLVGGVVVAGSAFAVIGLVTVPQYKKAAAAYNYATGIANNFQDRNLTLAIATVPGGVGLQLTF